MNSFEDNMKNLEEIVQALENNDISLEESIKLYEKGKKLSANCYNTLKKAELKITELEALEIGENDI